MEEYFSHEKGFPYIQHPLTPVSCPRPQRSTLTLYGISTRSDYANLFRLQDMNSRNTGFYYIHLLPTPDKFSRWRAFAHRDDAWPTARTSSMANALLPAKSGHLRSPYLSVNQARYPPICLAQAGPWYSHDSHEGYQHIPGRVSWAHLWIFVEWYLLQSQRNTQSLLSGNVLGLYVARSQTFQASP